MNFKKLLSVMVLCGLALTACTTGEKTKILEENVLVEEMKYSDKIKKETLEIPVEEGYRFEPGILYEDKIFGLYKSNNDVYDVYRAYYSKNDGLVKIEKRDLSANNENERMYIGWNGDTTNEKSTYIMRDNATGETMTLPEIKITEKENRVVNAPSMDKDSDGDINIEFLTSSEKCGRSEDRAMVIGNNNLGYTNITKYFYDNEPGEYITLGDKILQAGVNKTESVLVFYDFKNKKAITYDEVGYTESPVIRKIIYNESNGKLYAIAGFMENEIYEIEINDDTYTMRFFYKFDLGDRLTRVWQAGIFDNKLLIESYIWDDSNKEPYPMKEINKILLDLDTKTTQIIEEDTEDIRTEFSWSNSTKYLVTAKIDNKTMKARGFIGRMKENNIEYIYELDKYPRTVVMDEDEKRMLCDYGDNTMDIYTIDID